MIDIYINSSPAVSAYDGTIYVGAGNPFYGTGSNGLFAINPSTHDITWFFQTDDPAYYLRDIGRFVDSSPAMTARDLFGAERPVCDQYQRQPEMVFPVPDAANQVVDCSPALDANGNVLIGSSDGYVYCITPTGGLRWIFDTGTGAPIISSIAVGPGGLVVAATQSGMLFAITNGVFEWGFTNNYSAFISSPAITKDNVVVIGSEDGYVYGIANGAVKWSTNTGSAVLSSPAISPVTGAVIIGSTGGRRLFSGWFCGRSGHQQAHGDFSRQSESHRGAA